MRSTACTGSAHQIPLWFFFALAADTTGVGVELVEFMMIWAEVLAGRQVNCRSLKAASVNLAGDREEAAALPDRTFATSLTSTGLIWCRQNSAPPLYGCA